MHSIAQASSQAAATHELAQQRSVHITGIDGLRALAVLAVIIFHFMPTALPGGFCGVDIFFVISGYVVTGSLVRSKATSLRSFLSSFYARRILRIYPALALCLLVVAVFYALFIPTSALSSTSPKTAIAAFFGLSNFALIVFNDGYFSPTVEFNLFTHTWSLAVEEQFYFIYPFLFWFVFKSRQTAHGAYLTKYAIHAFVAASLACAYFLTKSNLDWAYYLLPSRFWELGAGALLFLMHQQGKLVPSSTLSSQGWTALGLIAIAVSVSMADKGSFPYPWALLPVAGTLMLISGVTSNARGPLSDAFSMPAAVYVGKISYSLYLWHWPIIVLFRWTTGSDSLEILLLAAVLTALLGAASFHLLEDPVRRHPVLNAWRDPTLILRGTITLGALCLFCGLVFLSQPYLSLSVTANKAIWSPQYVSTAAGTPVPTTRQLFIFGDSHAWAYRSMIARFVAEEGVKLHTYEHPGCPIANLMRPTTARCAKIIAADIEDIERKAKPGDVIFMASLRMNRFGDQWGALQFDKVVKTQASPEAARLRAVALEQADSLVKRFEQMGLRVIIDAPKPVFRAPPFRCSDWFNASNPVCAPGTTMNRQFLLDYRQPVMQSIAKLEQLHPKLVVWDAFPLLCPPGTSTCSAFDATGKPKVFDGDHLSGHGNAMVYPAFRALVAPLVKGGTQPS